jgi:hypothetical protein
VSRLLAEVLVRGYKILIFFEDSYEAEFVAHLDCLGYGVRRIIDTGH